MVVVVMLVLLGMVAMVVESREMVAAINLQSETSSSSAEEFVSVQVNSAATTATRVTTTSNVGSLGVRVGEDPLWDVEAESPPAQRQRDRSLWGMSKRLVPTGPNPLHN